MYRSSEISGRITNLRDFHPGTRLNILFYGPSSGGKSSLVNTLLCEGNDVVLAPEYAPRQSDIQGVRTDGSVYGAPIRDISSREPDHYYFGRYRFNNDVFVYDSPRIAESIGGKYFDLILDGKLSPSTIRSDFDQDDGSHILYGVVFVLDFRCVEQLEYKRRNDKLEHEEEFMIGEDEDELVLDRFKKYFDTCTENQIPFMIAVSKMDIFFNESSLVSPNIDLRKEPNAQIAWRTLIGGLWGELFVEPIRRIVGRSDVPIVPIVSYNAYDMYYDSFIDLVTQQFIRVFVRTFRLRAIGPSQPYVVDLLGGEEEGIRVANDAAIDDWNVQEIQIGKFPHPREEDFEEVETTDADFDTECFILSDLFARKLRLVDGMTYRLYVAGLVMAPDEIGARKKSVQLVGLIDPVNWVCFEAVVDDVSIVSQFQRSFGSEFILEYDFVTPTQQRRRRRRFTGEAKQMRLSLMGGQTVLKLNRTELRPIHAKIENEIQAVKRAVRRMKNRI